MNGPAILVVLEPSEADSVGDGAQRDPLVAQALRLAEAAGGAAAAWTWTDVAPHRLEAVAEALAARVSKSAVGLVVLPDSDVGRQLAPMLAHRLGTGALLGCTQVTFPEGVPTFTRPALGGWLEQETTYAPGRVQVVTLIVDAADPEGGPPPAELPVERADLEVPGLDGVVRLELLAPDARSVDLVHARRIVAVGSGAAREDLLDQARALADLLEGSVGATRPVVDDGRLPKERLVGQTGKTVAPDLYIALGVSGSPHHVAGIRGAERVVSVNHDPRAPMFQFSDVGFVAELEEVLPALLGKIQAWRDAAPTPEAVGSSAAGGGPGTEGAGS